MSQAIENVVRTKANFDELERGERLINEALADLEKAESCGLNCQDFREAAQAVMGRLAALKAAFFTPPPTR